MNPLLGADIPTSLSVHQAADPVLMQQPEVNRAPPRVSDQLSKNILNEYEIIFGGTR
jgi:hypothetical protein